jgi:hypothetical protein
MTKRTDQVNVRLDAKMKAKLGAYAKAEKRTVSNLIFLIITDWLEQREAESAKK